MKFYHGLFGDFLQKGTVMTKIVLKGIFDLIISKTHIAYPLSIYADIQQKYAAATKWL